MLGRKEVKVAHLFPTIAVDNLDRFRGGDHNYHHRTSADHHEPLRQNRRLSILVHAFVGPDGFQSYGADLLNLWRRQDSAGYFVHNSSQSSGKRGYFGTGYDASATLSMGNKTGAVEDPDVWVGFGRYRSDFLEQVGQTTICEKPQGRSVKTSRRLVGAHLPGRDQDLGWESPAFQEGRVHDGRSDWHPYFTGHL